MKSGSTSGSGLRLSALHASARDRTSSPSHRCIEATQASTVGIGIGISSQALAEIVHVAARHAPGLGRYVSPTMRATHPLRVTMDTPGISGVQLLLRSRHRRNYLRAILTAASWIGVGRIDR